MEIGWVIEYWEPASKWTSFYSSLDGDWRSAPRENVVYVWLFFGDGKRIRLSGVDFYFIVNGAFGGFNDSVVSETSTNDPGWYYYFQNDELKHIPLSCVPSGWYPEHISRNDIKAGVWVPSPCAEELGLVGDKRGKVPELRKYNG